MNDKGENLMHKNILFIGVLVGVLALAALTAYSQEDIEFVEDSGFVSNMRPLPAFMHDEHNDRTPIGGDTVTFRGGNIVG